jgi:Fe-S-cluster containining protein
MTRSACDCCGTCCRKGGPALHTADLELVKSGFLGRGDMVTIRCGEYIFYPFSDEPQPAREELLKIQGKGADWCCKFLDSGTSTCTIYRNRPLACRLLKCWDPDDVLGITGRELVTRFDFVPESNPMSGLMKEHEKNCPVPDIALLSTQPAEKKQQQELLTALTELVNRDLQIRSRAVRTFRLSLPDELFFFGRPIFQLLVPAGISMVESREGQVLQFNGT